MFISPIYSFKPHYHLFWPIICYLMIPSHLVLKPIVTTSLGKWASDEGVSLRLNDAVFNEELEKPTNPTGVILNSWKSYVQVQQDPIDSPTACTFSTSWHPPLPDWSKLNVDGAVSRASGKAGRGGVLRNHMGDWLAGFTRSIGVCRAPEDEEWAILEGLNMAWDLGYRKVELESDAKDLVYLLNDVAATNKGSMIIWEILELKRRDWELRISYIPRDANKVADLLAKEAIGYTSFLNECPGFIHSLVIHEKLGFISPG